MLHGTYMEETAMTDLTDRVVVVTGAAGGIGHALCRAFAAAGMRVGVCDVNAAGALTVAAELGADRAIAVEGDVADPASCERAVAAVTARFGTLHALVNNAGLGMGIIRQDHMTKPVGIDEVSVEVWHRFMNTNLSGAFHMTKAAMPHFRAARGGRIINVTTSMFTMLREGFYPYGVAKAGLEAWTASLAAELDGSGITVNVVVPGGPTDTPMVPVESGYDRAALIRPGQMAPPMLYLFSDQAAGVTGRRFVAANWDPALPAEQAAFVAGAPAGWPDLARSPVWPGGRPGR
jgi:NAD(P)-dependent dehydrogenase (short-subunit alcohol dehydrogenase family)